MSNARQRALLSALGIQQWIPRAVQTVIPNKSSAARLAISEQLWRQGNEDFFIDSANTILTTTDPSSTHRVNTDSLKNTASANNEISNTFNNDDAITEEINSNPHVSEPIAEPASEPEITNTRLAEQQITTLQNYQSAVAKSQAALSTLENPQALVALNSQSAVTALNDDSPSQIHSAKNSKNSFDEFDDVGNVLLLNPSATTNISFRLQACEINQWIILVNEDDLQDSAMQTLWQNILKAFNKPTIINFSWPLSEGQRWQRSIGAKSALNGFLFRMGLDKRVGLMSELSDDICPDRLERLPHLAELLAEPLKKRTLWHLLKVQ